MTIKTEQEILRIASQFNAENSQEGLLHTIKCLVGDKARDYQKLTQRTSSNQRNRVTLNPISN